MFYFWCKYKVNQHYHFFPLSITYPILYKKLHFIQRKQDQYAMEHYRIHGFRIMMQWRKTAGKKIIWNVVQFLQSWLPPHIMLSSCFQCRFCICLSDLFEDSNKLFFSTKKQQYFPASFKFPYNVTSYFAVGLLRRAHHLPLFNSELRLCI